jgi:Ca2+-binding EF-hand superfamily protein
LALGLVFAFASLSVAQDDEKPSKSKKGKKFDPQEMLEKAREAFKKADHDDDEHLSREEFANVLPKNLFSNKPAKAAPKTPPAKKPAKKGPPSLGIGAKPDEGKDGEEKKKEATEEDLMEKIPPVDAKKVSKEMDRIFKVADDNGDGKLSESEYMKVVNNYVNSIARISGS